MRKFLSVSAALVLGAAAVAGCGSSGSTATTKSPADLARSSDFGTMKNLCHKAQGTNKANSDRGVTANSINVTTISDAGSSLQPGLNQELWDAATVFTRWCNAHGGINGRQIVMTKGNAQVTQYKQVIDQACKTEFALVGGGGAFDNTAQADRVACKLVAMPGFEASPEARSAPLSYPAVANAVPTRTDGGHTYIRLHYGGNQKVAEVYGDFPSTLFTMSQQRGIFENKGQPVGRQQQCPGVGRQAGEHRLDAPLPAHGPRGLESHRPGHRAERRPRADVLRSTTGSGCPGDEARRRQ